jgi:uncharacterized surface protein with fasciclin (FAS1) repeats
MRATTLLAIGLLAVIAVDGPATYTAVRAQEKTVMVGGESMFPSRTIVANAMNSKDHTTLVAAVEAAGLTYHVVAGRLDTEWLWKKIRGGRRSPYLIANVVFRSISGLSELMTEQ